MLHKKKVIYNNSIYVLENVMGANIVPLKHFCIKSIWGIIETFIDNLNKNLTGLKAVSFPYALQ